MKVRKKYTLYINSMLGVAYYGNKKFSRRIRNATIGMIFECTLTELKDNIRKLLKKKYLVGRRTY